jgi:phosphinothricin acetyltransferase
MPSIRKQTIKGFKPGDSFSVSRTLSEEEVQRFADITRDYNPVHFDERFTRTKGLSGRICHGLLVAGMISEIGGQMGWLASEMKFRFKKPVYFGDTILCTLTITSVLDSGRAEAEAVLQNQNRKIVLEGSLKGILPDGAGRKVLRAMVAEGDPTNKLSAKHFDLHPRKISAHGREKKGKPAIDRFMPEDWEEVRAIYQEGIATGHATFEAEAPEWGKWDSAHLPDPRLVARAGSGIMGWAALSRVSPREVYSGVAEVSLYVRRDHQGKGFGSALLAALVKASEQKGIWTLQAGIFPENVSSIELHKQHGFRVLGMREKVGKMAFGEYAGRWRDVVLMERRSKVTGMD